VKKELVDQAEKKVTITDIKLSPEKYVGKIFILGGIIAKIDMTKDGSIIDAASIAVTNSGYIIDSSSSIGRFKALFPINKGMVDPVIFKPDRKITIAGRFVEIQSGTIGDMPYDFPYFEIIELYLWEEPDNRYIQSPPIFFIRHSYWF
jgi:outer membrane lipoprotein